MPNRINILDHRLLDEFQRGLALAPRPYAAIGEALNIDECEVIKRLSSLTDRGYISRVGATIRPNTAGASTLAAMSVPQQQVEKVAALVGAEAGINHSYLREDDWNLWFVATAPTSDELQALLDRLSAVTGFHIFNLLLLRPFNIDLGFSLSVRSVFMPNW